MLIRTLTGIGIAIIVFGCAIMGKTTMGMLLLLFSMVATKELYDVTQVNSKGFRILGYISNICYFKYIEYLYNNLGLYLCGVLSVGLALYTYKHKKYNIKDLSMVILGLLYPAFMFGCIVLLYNSELSMFWVASVFLIACCSDTCAYFTGMMLGKHKLAPILSPKKTIEGSIGGIIGTGIATYLLISCFFSKHPILRDNIYIVVGVYMIIALLSQIGDLIASAIKREYGAKDYGDILPGHGGILDRFDSILFISPLVYLLSNII